jgi:hypothetical protein
MQERAKAVSNTARSVTARRVAREGATAMLNFLRGLFRTAPSTALAKPDGLTLCGHCGAQLPSWLSDCLDCEDTVDDVDGAPLPVVEA